MTTTAGQLKEIQHEFARLKPAAITLDGNRAMTVKHGYLHPRPGIGTDEKTRL